MIKELYLYGAGLYGKKAVDAINKYSDLKITGVIDREKNGYIEKYKIISAQEAEELLDDGATVVFTMADIRACVESYLLFREKCNIMGYIYLHKDYTSGKSFFENECLELPESVENYLPTIEMSVVDYCNLNCKGCTHYSAIYPKIFPNFQRRIQDIVKLSRLYEGIIITTLLGGEPLLNPELSQYILEVRRVLPKTEIQIVTNGLLIPKLDDEILNIMCENNVTIVISEYKPTHTMISQICEKLITHKVDYVVRGYDRKSKFKLTLKDHLEVDCPRGCISDGCISACDGKIARCPNLLYIEKLNEYFGKTFPTDGIYDLATESDGLKLLEKLKKTVPLCAYCIDKTIDWEPCTLKPCYEDFVVCK